MFAGQVVKRHRVSFLYKSQKMPLDIYYFTLEK